MKSWTITYSYGRLLLLSLIVIIGLGACNQKEAKSTPSSGLELPEDFKVFYDKFHKDSVYQMEHIVFPLQGRPDDAQGKVDFSNFLWEESEWRMHKDFGDLLDSYEKRYSGDSSHITEEIYHKTGTFKIERRFSKIGKQWFLVYYAGLSMQKDIFENYREHEAPLGEENGIDIRIGN